ncbi:unnamed protein product [Gadus morhua 'NCC']
MNEPQRVGAVALGPAAVLPTTPPCSTSSRRQESAAAAPPVARWRRKASTAVRLNEPIRGWERAIPQPLRWNVNIPAITHKPQTEALTSQTVV